ncbi:hypothetical protein KIH75_04235 [Bifidobacterium sp. 64T4]|nr:hypothetical protein [Bifidobacterium pongonis]MBW3094562.1 hypothetical protein [Bifidobacterium pongonis]
MPATERNVDAMAATLGGALHGLCVQRGWEAIDDAVAPGGLPDQPEA